MTVNPLFPIAEQTVHQLRWPLDCNLKSIHETQEQSYDQLKKGALRWDKRRNARNFKASPVPHVLKSGKSQHAVKLQSCD